MASESSSSARIAILHQIRNCLGPLQTFLDVLDTSKEDTEIRSFHKRCRENFSELKELLKKLEQI